MEVLLDSSFIISCVKRKIDFLSELRELGYLPVLPREVFQELKDLRLRVPHTERVAIDVALQIFASSRVKKMRLGQMSVDQGLIEKGRKGYAIATLDTAIKREVPHHVLISDAKNAIVVERT